MSSPTSVDEAAGLVVGPWHMQSSEGPTVLMSRIYYLSFVVPQVKNAASSPCLPPTTSCPKQFDY